MIAYTSRLIALTYRQNLLATISPDRKQADWFSGNFDLRDSLLLSSVTTWAIHWGRSLWVGTALAVGSRPWGGTAKNAETMDQSAQP